MKEKQMIDCAKTIKYILENFQQLNLTGKEMEEIIASLEFLKSQVKQLIIQEAVLGNEDIGRQIQEAKQILEKRIEKVKQQKETAEAELSYPEFSPKKEEIENVPSALQERVETDDRKKYETEKSQWERTTKPKIEEEIKSLEGMIEQLNKCVDYLGKPEEFIKQFLSRELHAESERDSEQYQNLMNSCATNMAYGYLEMEHSRTSLEPLFFHDKDSGNSTGYTPNPEAISEFLSLIRNEEVVEQLDVYDKVREQERHIESQIQEAQKELENAKHQKSLLDNPEIYTMVEERITELGKLYEKKATIQQERKQNQLPQTTSRFKNFINRIFGRTKKVQKRGYELAEQEAKYDIAIKETIKRQTDEETKMPEERGEVFAEQYKEMYKMYLKSVGIELDDTPLFPRENEIRKSEAIIKLSNKAKTQNLHDFVEGFVNPSEQISVAEKNISSLNSQLELIQPKVREKYEGLTPEAQGWADKDVHMYDIKTRYIDIDSNNRYGVSPFVSSLILETLMEAKDIRTADDLEKYGISITDKDVEEYSGKIGEMSTKIMNQLKNAIGQEQSEK